jgi:hypothetical protein
MELNQMEQEAVVVAQLEFILRWEESKGVGEDKDVELINATIRVLKEFKVDK